MSRIYPNTTVRWPDPSDAPNSEETEIEHAHVVHHGDRLTVRKRDALGRMSPVDTLIEVSVKGTGKDAVAVGRSMFMMDRIGLSREEAEVTIVFDGSRTKCVNC